MRKKGMLICAAVLLSSFGLGGCKSGPKVAADTAAIVNNKEIRLAEVEKVFQSRAKQSNQTLSLEEAQSLRLEILRQLINDEMLMQQAKQDITARWNLFTQLAAMHTPGNHEPAAGAKSETEK